MSQQHQDLIRQFAEVVNANSLENPSSTPDFILGEYLFHCWLAYSTAVKARDKWHEPAPKTAEPITGDNPLVAEIDRQQALAEKMHDNTWNLVEELKAARVENDRLLKILQFVQVLDTLDKTQKELQAVAEVAVRWQDKNKYLEEVIEKMQQKALELYGAQIELEP